MDVSEVDLGEHVNVVVLEQPLRYAKVAVGTTVERLGPLT